MTQLSGKNILVTGGCGSIGTPLVSKILEKNPGVVRILDNDEQRLFELQQDLGDDNQVRYLLGDIRDQDRLILAVEDIDIIFHAAALKHVEINEYNPFETVQTNVIGTQNLIRVALDEEIESFVGISTDKASSPASVMGATKLLSERLIIAANAYKGNRQTKFGCVRFGNVIGSSGSVVPLFLDQIREGGPVTVTDPEMTRFIMPIDEAAQLVLKAHDKITSGEVFVLKMPAFRVGTLADAMISKLAPTFGYDPANIDIKIIGARPGERQHEKLISPGEVGHALELKDMFVILPQIDIAGYVATNYSDASKVTEEYSSNQATTMSENELIDVLDKNAVFTT